MSDCLSLPHSDQDQGDQAADNEWRETSLGEVLTLQRGFDLPKSKRLPGPYPVIASTGPVGTHSIASVQGPGVLIGRSGSLGGGQFITSDFWPLNTTLWVKDFQGNDRRFCYYLLKSLDLAQFNVGSGVPTLNRNHIHPLPVRVPPRSEQRAIAHILGTLDDKLELNRRMNQTLEEMARALFKSWFVDFDPVRAKAALKQHALRGDEAEAVAAPASQESEWTVERARAYLAGLDPQIADLFPDRLVPLELGEIPDGWLIQPLEKAAHTTYGAPFSSRRFNSDGFGTPLIRIRDLATHSPSVFTEETHPKGQIIRPGDIVAGMDGEFRVHIWKGPSSWLNQRLCRFEPLPHVPKVFLFESLIGPLADSERSKVGTTVIHLGKRDIDTFTLLMPTQSILDQFSCLTEPIARRLVANASQTRAIAAQRDALLPQLVNGQLKANNAARHITGVD